MSQVSAFSEERRRYEGRYTKRVFVPGNPIIARLDWRAFSTWTRSLSLPYHRGLSDLMIFCTKYLVESTQANVGYTQSDEISLLYTYDTFEQMFFGGKEFKYISILSSKLTKAFAFHVQEYVPEKSYSDINTLPECDCRVFDVPTKYEAYLQFVDRESDATRNSISKLARSFFSHRMLDGVSSKDMLDMLVNEKDVHWNQYPNSFKRGTYVMRKRVVRPFTTKEIEKLPLKHEARSNPDLEIERWNVDVVEMPPLRRVVNGVSVFFDNADPLEEKAVVV